MAQFIAHLLRAHSRSASLCVAPWCKRWCHPETECETHRLVVHGEYSFQRIAVADIEPIQAVNVRHV